MGVFPPRLINDLSTIVVTAASGNSPIANTDTTLRSAYSEPSVNGSKRAPLPSRKAGRNRLMLAKLKPNTKAPSGRDNSPKQIATPRLNLVRSGARIAEVTIPAITPAVTIAGMSARALNKSAKTPGATDQSSPLTVPNTKRRAKVFMCLSALLPYRVTVTNLTRSLPCVPTSFKPANTHFCLRPLSLRA